MVAAHHARHVMRVTQRLDSKVDVLARALKKVEQLVTSDRM